MTSPQSPSGRWPFQWKRSEQRCLPRELVEHRGVTFSSLSGPNFRNHPELTNGRHGDEHQRRRRRWVGGVALLWVFKLLADLAELGVRLCQIAVAAAGAGRAGRQCRLRRVVEAGRAEDGGGQRRGLASKSSCRGRASPRARPGPASSGRSRWGGRRAVAGAQTVRPDAARQRAYQRRSGRAHPGRGVVAPVVGDDAVVADVVEARARLLAGLDHRGAREVVRRPERHRQLADAGWGVGWGRAHG